MKQLLLFFLLVGSLQAQILLFDIGKADTIPSAFTFTDQTLAEFSTEYTSDSIIVGGISGTTHISITDGEYRDSTNGTFTSDAGTVTVGDTIWVKGTSSASGETAVNVVLTIGGISDTYSITTRVMTYADTAKTYYVDNTRATNNDDTLATIAEVNALTLNPADQVLFKRGVEWREQLTVPNSGAEGYPIVFSDYGSGEKPIIDGADEVSGFVDDELGGELFTSFTAGVTYPYQTLTFSNDTISSAINTTSWSSVYVDNIVVITDSSDYEITFDLTLNSGTAPTVILIGNGNAITGNESTTSYVADAGANSDTLTVTTAGTYDLTFYQSAVGNWSLSDLSIKKISAGDSVWQKSGITVEPNLAYLNDTVATQQDSLAACTSKGDWYYDGGSNIFYIYSTSDPSGNVEIAQREEVVDLGVTNYITFENLTMQHANYTACIISNSSGGGNYTFDSCTVQDNAFTAFYFYDVSDVVIDLCTITRNGWQEKTGVGIWFVTKTAWSSNFTFTNNTLSYIGQTGIYSSTNYLDPTQYGYTNWAIHDNNISHCFDAGIYPAGVDTLAIYNNTIDSCGDFTDAGEDYAIAISNCRNTDIYNNTITNQLNNDAIQMWSSNTYALSTIWNVRIFNNSIVGVTNGSGIGGNVYGDSSAQNVQVYYNLIADVEKYGIHFGTESVDSIAYPINIFNNTIYETGIRSIDITVNFPVVLRNNIMYKDTTAVGYNMDENSSTSGLTTSNNLWISNAGGLLKYNGTNYNTGNITTFEATAQTADPAFTVNGSDFTLQAGSPAINAGTDVGLTQDILGNPIVGNPDIGCYEKQD